MEQLDPSQDRQAEYNIFDELDPKLNEINGLSRVLELTKRFLYAGSAMNAGFVAVNVYTGVTPMTYLNGFMAVVGAGSVHYISRLESRLDEEAIDHKIIASELLKLNQD